MVIGASDEALHAISVAHGMGLSVTALDGNPAAAGLVAADKALVIDISQPDLVEAALPERPDVLLPVPIGRYLVTTGLTNDHFGLPGVTAQSARLCTDKLAFNQAMLAHGLRRYPVGVIPAGSSLAEAVWPDEYPVVVKPRFGSGSRGVMVCETATELRAHLTAVTPSGDDLLLEEFADGPEYGLDAAVVGGNLEPILLREKLITPLPYRQAVGYFSVADDSGQVTMDDVRAVMEPAVAALHLVDCLLHADLIWSGGKFFVVEISARPSGHHLHDLFTPLATGVDPVREFIKLAVPSLGIQPRFGPDHVRRLLIRFFDFENCVVTKVPDPLRLRDEYRLIAYEENCLGLRAGRVTDGPTLMSRGYFILEGDDRADLETQAERLLREFEREVIAT